MKVISLKLSEDIKRIELVNELYKCKICEKEFYVEKEDTEREIFCPCCNSSECEKIAITLSVNAMCL